MAAVAKVMTMNSARSNFDSVFYSVARYNEPVTVVSDDDEAVVFVNADEWSGIQETLYLSSIPGMVEKINAADDDPMEYDIPASEADFGI